MRVRFMRHRLLFGRQQSNEVGTKIRSKVGVYSWQCHSQSYNYQNPW